MDALNKDKKTVRGGCTGLHRVKFPRIRTVYNIYSPELSMDLDLTELAAAYCVSSDSSSCILEPGYYFMNKLIMIWLRR